MTRAKWIFAGVALASATAMASPSVSFNTVFDSTSTFDSGGALVAGIQVVVGTGGDVFTNAFLNNGNEAIIYSNQTSPNVWASQDVFDPSTPVAGVSGAVSNIDNFALSENSSGDKRLFFAAGVDVSHSGILQLDVTGGGPAVSDVAFDSDGGSYSFSGVNSVANPDGSLGLQANGNGQVLFPANTPLHAGVLAQGNAAGKSTVFTPSSSLALSGVTLRTGIGSESPTPSELAQLTASPGSPGAYIISGSPQIPPVSTPYAPATSGASMVMGYTNNASTSAVLLLVQGTGVSGGGSTQDVVLSKNGGAPVPILAAGATAITPASGVNALGELSPQGRIALYVPDGVGDDHDTIQYANTSISAPASIIAAVSTDATAPATSKVALSNGSPLPIIGLQSGGSNWVPQINDGGMMIFNAEVFDPSLSSNEQALLEWDPSKVGASPIVLLETGQPVDLGGVPSSSVLDSYSLTDLAQENDFYKNAMSNDSYIGVSVNYHDGTNAVIITQVQVPEPATIALLPIAGLSLLARRRRAIWSLSRLNAHGAAVG